MADRYATGPEVRAIRDADAGHITTAADGTVWREVGTKWQRTRTGPAFRSAAAAGWVAEGTQGVWEPTDTGRAEMARDDAERAVRRAPGMGGGRA